MSRVAVIGEFVAYYIALLIRNTGLESLHFPSTKLYVYHSLQKLMRMKKKILKLKYFYYTEKCIYLILTLPIPFQISLLNLTKNKLRM